MAEAFGRTINKKKKTVEIEIEEIVVEFSLNQIAEALCEKYKNIMFGPEKFKLPDPTNITVTGDKVKFTWEKGKI